MEISTLQNMLLLIQKEWGQYTHDFFFLLLFFVLFEQTFCLTVTLMSFCGLC